MEISHPFLEMQIMLFKSFWLFAIHVSLCPLQPSLPCHVRKFLITNHYETKQKSDSLFFNNCQKQILSSNKKKTFTKLVKMATPQTLAAGGNE